MTGFVIEDGGGGGPLDGTFWVSNFRAAFDICTEPGAPTAADADVVDVVEGGTAEVTGTEGVGAIEPGWENKWIIIKMDFHTIAIISFFFSNFENGVNWNINNYIKI